MGSFTNNVLVGLVVSFSSLFASRKRRAALVSAALITVLVVGTYAYLQSLPRAAGPKVTLTSPPIEFSTEVDKAGYQYGENITITFLLRNTSNDTITITKPTMWVIVPGLFPIPTESYLASPEKGVRGYFHFGFSITHQNGTEIWKQYSGLYQTIYTIYIEPAGYVKQTWEWDMPLPQGVYYIRGILYCEIPDAFALSILETPTITITII